MFAGRSEQLVAEVRDDGAAALSRACRGKSHPSYAWQACKKESVTIDFLVVCRVQGRVAATLDLS